MYAGKFVLYCSDLFLLDTKRHFSLTQEVFSTETRIWPDFFLMNASDFFLRLLDSR